MSTVGRYELFDVIGEGGMATVHLARSGGAGGFSRVVAIKRLRPHLARDPEFVAMFVDEARVASRIRHPNVVQIFDVLSVGGELLLVLEYVNGVPLSRLVGPADGGALPPAIAVSLFCGVLAGLHAAHEARDESGHALQIVHRDVSPQNVLVGTDGLAHLLDFGIAKSIGRSHVTRDGALKGKVPYMAPEHLRGEAVTRAADIYAASVSLWEAITGRPLFSAADQANLVVQVLAAPVSAPSTVVPGIPAALDAVVMRGLDRDRARRFPTAAAMARALEEAVTPASANAVGDWLVERAGTMLEARARAVASVETAPVGVEAQRVAETVSTPEEATKTVAPERTAPQAPRARRMERPFLLVGSIGALSAALLALAFAPRSCEGERPLPSPVEPPAPLTPPPPPATPDSATTMDAPDAAPLRSHAPRAMPSSRGTTEVRPPAKPPPDACDPPYTLQGEHKVWKRNCL